jgi:hypothetical protein
MKKLSLADWIFNCLFKFSKHNALTIYKRCYSEDV